MQPTKPFQAYIPRRFGCSATRPTVQPEDRSRVWNWRSGRYDDHIKSDLSTSLSPPILKDAIRTALGVR